MQSIIIEDKITWMDSNLENMTISMIFVKGVKAYK